MAGSAKVIANLAGWEAMILKACEAEMGIHIKRSEEYAKASNRWDDKTSHAREGLTGSEPYNEGTNIMVSISHFKSYGEWLERREAFGGRHKILEAARNHGLVYLWSRLRALLSGRGIITGGR